jgi:hypothetical protein
MRSAISSGCSTRLVVWLMTPGMRTIPAGGLTCSKTWYSCSWRGLAASNEYAAIRGLRQAKGLLHVFDRFGDENGGLAAEFGLSFVRRGDAAFER